jgi:hypothetical protein
VAAFKLEETQAAEQRRSAALCHRRALEQQARAWAAGRTHAVRRGAARGPPGHVGFPSSRTYTRVHHPAAANTPPPTTQPPRTCQILDLQARAVGEDILMDARERRLNSRLLGAARVPLPQAPEWGALQGGP